MPIVLFRDPSNVVDTAFSFFGLAGVRSALTTRSIQQLIWVGRMGSQMDGAAPQLVEAETASQIDEIVRMGYVREYHAWEVATKRYRAAIYKLNNCVDEPSWTKGISWVENVRKHYTNDFGETGIEEPLALIDAIRVRVNEMKHDGDRLLGLSDYESAAATVQTFWKRLMEREVVIDGPRVSPTSIREALLAVVPSAMADAIIAMTGFTNADFKYTSEQVAQGNNFFSTVPRKRD